MGEEPVSYIMIQLQIYHRNHRSVSLINSVFSFWMCKKLWFTKSWWNNPRCSTTRGAYKYLIQEILLKIKFGGKISKFNIPLGHSPAWFAFYKSYNRHAKVKNLNNTLRPSDIFASVYWVIISSGNGLVPVQCQAITWNNAAWLSIGPFKL